MEHCDDGGKMELSYGGKTETIWFSMAHDTTYISKEGGKGKPSLGLEFFSLDYYSEDYLFEDFKSDAQQIKLNTSNFHTQEEKNNYVKNEIKNNKYVLEKGSLVFFGFDNMNSANLHSNEKMIKEEVLFPLKKIEYERKQFWIPNKPEEFLTYIYKDIWDFPKDVGIIKHNLASED